MQNDARARLLAGLPVEERRLSLAGISTSFLEGGDGSPVVLLHGPGVYGAAWLRVIPALARKHHVIAPDLPGQGASTVGNGPLDADRVLEWIGELIDSTCASRPALVGQLTGGAMAARFALDNPDRIDRLVLVVPLGLAPFEPSPEFAAALTGYLAQPTADTHDELWRHCVSDFDGLRRELDTQWEPMKAYNLDRARTPSVSAAQGILIEQFGLPEIQPELLARIAVPTALIWGRHDSIVRLSVGEAASARYGWQLHVVEDAGNEPALEAPEAFVQALTAALDAPAEVTA